MCIFKHKRYEYFSTRDFFSSKTPEKHEKLMLLLCFDCKFCRLDIFNETTKKKISEYGWIVKVHPIVQHVQSHFEYLLDTKR